MADEVAKIAASLTKAQVAYILACGASAEPYKPRHGRSANWALRHKFAVTYVRTRDGITAPWPEIPFNDAEEILGQRLTEKGKAVEHTLRSNRHEGSLV